jgi:hypothetical protein
MHKDDIDTFPTGDQAFRRAARCLAAGGHPVSAAELAARLRPLFPRVAVFERQLSGEARRFYAYRDGHYEVSRPERWWQAPHWPRVRVSVETGRLTAVSDESSPVMDMHLPQLVGRHVNEFVQPAAARVAAAMFEALVEEREVLSQALVIRPDGGELLIEFHAARQDGEIEVIYRPVAAATAGPPA